MRSARGLFIAEGPADAPLADIVESLFLDRGFSLTLSRPDLSMLAQKVGRDVASKLTAGRSLQREHVDVVVVHRDADNRGHDARVAEIQSAARTTALCPLVIPVVPVRMTEAWLLLDEDAIRTVAGHPRGRSPLVLPKHHEAEGLADPKAILADLLDKAAGVTGRRRQQLRRRYSENRRQLLERLDLDGPVTKLPSWRALVTSIDAVVRVWRTADGGPGSTTSG
jgi:hypothetical protein